MKVPIPGRNLTSRQIAEARGWADAFALKLRHHNAAAHAKSRPVEPVARAVFDALEQVRVEALGAREMEGVAANLSQMVETRVQADQIVRARNKAAVPLARTENRRSGKGWLRAWEMCAGREQSKTK